MASIYSFLSLSKDVIEVYNNENVELFCKDLVDVALEHGRCLDQSKKYYLVFQVFITGLEGCLSFITFFDSYLMIDIG